MPAPTPLNITDPTLRLSILVNGSALRDYFPVRGITITHEVNRISSAEISIVYERAENSDASADKAALATGAPIDIQAAYGSEAPVSIFKGLIMKQKMQMKDTGAQNVTINCKHKALDMTATTIAKSFADQTDSAIIQKLIGASQNSLTPSVEATTATQPYMPKLEGTSDWDFMLTRAEFNGQIVILDGDKVVVTKPKLDGSAVLRIAMGESVITFSAEINAENQPSHVEAYVLNGEEEVAVKSTEPTLPEPLNTIIANAKAKQNDPEVLPFNPELKQEDLQTWVDGKVLRMRLAALRGQVTFMGNAVIKSGDMLELADIDTQYNGTVFVSAIVHTINEGSWTTTAKFGLEDKSISAQSDFSAQPGGGQVPPVHGLQIGKVKKLFSDPDAAYRVQVQMHSSSQTDELVWARVSNLFANNGSGSFFLPDVDDDVVIGFVESDPRFPVILGSLYGKKQKSPVEGADNNNYIKSITTKNKLKITFDDEKKILTIATPAGNTITCDDDAKSVEIKDQNSNKVSMNADGITVKTEKKLTLQATGDIVLDATGNVKISAKQDVVLEGANVTHNAKMGFTAKGNATAELSASGQTTVKGGMVMIN